MFQSFSYINQLLQHRHSLQHNIKISQIYLIWLQCAQLTICFNFIPKQAVVRTLLAAVCTARHGSPYRSVTVHLYPAGTKGVTLYMRHFIHFPNFIWPSSNKFWIALLKCDKISIFFTLAGNWTILNFGFIRKNVLKFYFILTTQLHFGSLQLQYILIQFTPSIKSCQIISFQ